jgi:hypothetical protein
MRFDSPVGLRGACVRARAIVSLAALAAVSLTGCSSGSGPEGSFTLTLSSGTLSINQGASGAVTVTITRDADFDGAVTITVEGLPTGVTANALTIASGSTEGVLTLTGLVSAAAGPATLTVRGSATGAADDTATLALTVLAPGSGNSSVEFCAATGLPIWVAYRDGNGSWTQASGAGPTYTFQLNQSTAGVAWVMNDGAGGFNLTVFFGTQAEVNALGSAACAAIGGKTVTGTVQGLIPTAFGTAVTLGGRPAVPAPTIANPAITFSNVRDGQVDLVGGFSALVGIGAVVPTRMFIRRNLNPAGGSAINDIDFNGADGFATQANALVVNNVGGGEAVLQTTQFMTANGSALVGQVLGPTAATNWYGAPAARLAAGDLHMLTILATQPVAGAPQRQVFHMIAQPGNLNVTLGPLLTQPNVLAVAATGYSRVRAEYAIQAEYDRYWLATLTQATAGQTRQAQIQMTQGFRGSGQGTATLEIPDFTGVGGWTATWGPRPGNAATWVFVASGWASQGGVSQPVTADGNQALSANRTGQITP